MKLKYAVIYERTPDNYSAYAPDLPGCISTGKTWEEIQKNIRESITSHIESLMEYGDFDPQPQISTDEAMSFHCKALTECDDPVTQLELETTVGVTEVEVKRPRIIIDASYIRGMKQDGAPLRTIRKQGGRIVVTDTLLFELFSTSNTNQWNASKRKLVACRDAIEVWEHVSEMYRVELEENRPYGDPFHVEGTKRFQKMLAENPQYEPNNRDEIIEEARQEREGPDISELFQHFSELSEEPELEEVKAKIKDKAPHDKEVVQTCYDLINDPSNIRSMIKVIRDVMGNDMTISLNPQDVNEKWVLWHFSKSLLTVFCDCLRLGKNAFRKLSKGHRKRLINAKHDLDYLVLLAFADAIASRETKGELFYYRRWMFGDRSKSLIRSYEKEQIVHTFRQMSRITVYVAEQLDGYTCALDPWSRVSLKIEDSRKLPKSIFISYGTQQHFESVHGPAWEQTVKILTSYSATELQEFGRVVFVDSRTMEILPDPSAQHV